MAIVNETELALVQPGYPVCGAVVGSLLVTCGATRTGATLGPGTFTITDLSTGAEASYSGLAGGSRDPNCATAFGGLVWTINYSGAYSSPNRQLQAINPLTGGVTTIANSPVVEYARRVFAAGGTIWASPNYGSYRGYNPATDTALTTTISGSSGVAIGGHSGRVFIGGYEVNPSDGSTIGALPSPGLSYHYEGVPHGDYLLWGTFTGGVIARLHVPTTTFDTISLTPAPTFDTSNIIKHGDYLAKLHNPGNTGPYRVIQIDPDTGKWSDQTLGTSLGYVHFMASWGGKLWLPSGNPHTV